MYPSVPTEVAIIPLVKLLPLCRQGTLRAYLELHDLEERIARSTYQRPSA